jgi:hypothetical protein
MREDDLIRAVEDASLRSILDLKGKLKSKKGHIRERKAMAK